MAIYRLHVRMVKRSMGQSAVASAAYRAGEKLDDLRTGITHDYRRKGGVERSEILAPDNAPAWVYDRSTLWNTIEREEPRKDGQTAREVQLTIPRELNQEQRFKLVRDFVRDTYVSRGMVADIAWHNKIASDGKEQPHAHVLLTLRHVSESGFGKKSRHEYIPDPSGAKHPDGKPVLIIDNPDSWNNPALVDQARLDWENKANDALATAGSEARIDRRSLLERGITRMPEPALRMAWYMRDLYGCMKDRFGQYLASKHFRAVEDRAKDAFARIERGDGPISKKVQAAERFYGWFDRQIDRLAPRDGPELARESGPSRGVDL